MQPSAHAVNARQPVSAAPPLRHGAAQRAHDAWQRGVNLRKAGRLPAARDCFAEATRRAPGDALYWLNLARCEQLLSRPDQATAHAQRAFSLDRRSLVACNLLAELMRDALRAGESLQALDQLDPAVERDAQWHLLRGCALLAEHQPDAAAHAFTEVLALPGTDFKLHCQALTQLGNALSNLKRHQEASRCHRMVLKVDPLALGNALYAAHYSSWCCDWPQLADDLARLDSCIAALQLLPPSVERKRLPPFALVGLSDDPQLMRWLAEQDRAGWGVGPGRSPVRSIAPVPRPGGKLRIGLLSADFHHHATSFLLAEMLESIDRDRFELVFYASGPDDRSPTRQRVLASAHQVHEVAEWSDDGLAAQIRRDQVAVLLDLKGFTLGTRLDAMAQRPAPIQVAWLGYPATTGADFIDYLIGDTVVTPLDAQAHYSERIAQMPHCYQPNDSQRSRPAALSRADCGLPEHRLVLASFNQSYKIMPPVFEAWCRILAASDGAVLWLLVPAADTQARLLQVAAGHGIAPQRLVFAPFLAIEQHRARLPNADLFLDTYPCGGHTTASDALWAGVPVLTLIGDTFASRVAASLLCTLGLPELVCDGLNAYIDQALHYAADRPALAALRERLEVGRAQSPLFDGRHFARDFEQLLLRMVARQDAGLPPAPLPADTTAAMLALPHRPAVP
jgi:predicted O-linked N-acetylglucosamine transferase (SPINDLY family)